MHPTRLPDIELQDLSQRHGKCESSSNTACNEKLFIDALERNAPEKEVQQLIQQCRNVNRFIEGSAPIHIACKKGNRVALQCLIKQNANVHLFSSEGLAPLHYAAYRGSHRACALLLGAGANANVRAEDGWTPLHIAADRNCPKTFKLLASQGGGPFERDICGLTPFYYASQAGSLPIVKYYISIGASPDDCVRRPCSDGRYTRTPRNSAGNAEVSRYFSKTCPDTKDKIAASFGKSYNRLKNKDQ